MTIKELYESINGDYNKAVSIMMNDSFISRMLIEFSKTELINELIEAYQNKDFKTVFEKSHSLKGICGNLALSPLYKLSSIITEKTRNYSEISNIDLDEEITKLNDEFQHLKELISQLQQ